MKNGSGIYRIVDLKGRVYVGSAVDLNRRCNRHFATLKRGTHYNKKLLNVFSKYGESSLTFEIIEYCEIENLLCREQFYIDTLKPFFNNCLVAGSPLGIKHSDETKRKQSEKRVGVKIHSDEFKNRVSESNKNRVWTDEMKLKMSESKKGKKLSEEHKLAIGLFFKGKKLSEGHKRKIGEKSKGRKCSENTKQAVAKANKERIISDETRKKISEGSKGRIFSEESKLKKSESMKKYFLNKKQQQNYAYSAH